MLEDRRAEYRVDAVAGMQHQVLTDPSEHRGEHHEDRQPDADHDQRALRAVHDHLVDDDLGEQRRGEREQLDHQGSGEHLGPDAAVLQQFWNEPAEAKARGPLGGLIRIVDMASDRREQDDGPGIQPFERLERISRGRVGAGVKKHHAIRMSLHQHRQARFGARRAVVAAPPPSPVSTIRHGIGASRSRASSHPRWCALKPSARAAMTSVSVPCSGGCC